MKVPDVKGDCSDRDNMSCMGSWYLLLCKVPSMRLLRMKLEEAVRTS